ncbi:hypothetical protein [Streptomyces nanshensis]|nr:hypothetical protein [Streptomyces nanshensis]
MTNHGGDRAGPGTGHTLREIRAEHRAKRDVTVTVCVWALAGVLAAAGCMYLFSHLPALADLVWG